jgi:hypothetical protein
MTGIAGQQLLPAHAILGAMKETGQQLIAGFAPGEREYIRRELDQFFSTLPTVAEGFPLRVWRGGQHVGEPKIPPSAGSLLARGLMRLDAAQWPPRLFFTANGLSALCAMMRDRRLADPLKFAHVRRELGID